MVGDDSALRKVAVGVYGCGVVPLVSALMVVNAPTSFAYPAAPAGLVFSAEDDSSDVTDDDSDDSSDSDSDDENSDGMYCPSTPTVQKAHKKSTTTAVKARKIRAQYRDALQSSYTQKARKIHRRLDKQIRLHQEARQRYLLLKEKTDTCPPSTKVGPQPTIGAYTPGTYTGIVSTKNKYGGVQVQITVDASSILEVRTLSYPTKGSSGPINDYAIPKLEKSALVAQSATIATVSGASLTTPAFKESLQSAIVSATRA